MGKDGNISGEKAMAGGSRNLGAMLGNGAKGFLSKNAMLVIMLLVLVLFEVMLSGGRIGTMFSPDNLRSLLSPANLTNLIRQNSYVVILAAGMLLCILTGGNIDLSVGSVVALVGAISGVFMVNWGLNPYLSVVLCLLIGTAIGAWQAFWIAYVGIPPFITTLAGMLTFRGLTLLILDGKGISGYPDEFLNIFNSYVPGQGSDANLIYSLSLIVAVVLCAILIGVQVFSRIQKKRKGYEVDNLGLMIFRLAIICGVFLFVFERLGKRDGMPIILVIIGVVVIFYSYFTLNTVPGRYLYAMGGNQKAARLSGINTKKMMFFAYTNMGFLAGLTGLVVAARFAQANTQAGSGFELDAIGACFIGGASAYGGIGTVSGAVIGAIFMGILNMGMSILGWNQNLQSVIKGLVLLAAVIFDVVSKNRKQLA